MRNTSAPITIDVDEPVEIYSGLEDAGEIFVCGPLAVYVFFSLPPHSPHNGLSTNKGKLTKKRTRINFTNLTTSWSLNITTSSTTPISCPEALVDMYRYFSDPVEPSLCNPDSLAAAGENPLSRSRIHTDLCGNRNPSNDNHNHIRMGFCPNAVGYTESDSIPKLQSDTNT
jgi:hypothetical protein